MLISEMILLMFLDESKGKIYSRGRTTKDLGLAGAMILDLYLKGKVSIYGKKLKILNYCHSGLPYVDKILVFLYRSKRPLKLRSWLNKISQFYKKSSLYFYQRLESHGIIIGGFKARRFYLTEPEVKYSLLEKVKNVVINNMNPDIELLCLLSLMKACRLIKVYFMRKYRKYVKRRIKELLHSSYYSSETREMILGVIKAIEDIIRARTTASAVVATF